MESNSEVDNAIQETSLPIKPPLKDWSQNLVLEWVEIHFGKEIAQKFLDEEIIGETLNTERITTDKVMERLGLQTLGKQEKFKSLLQDLKGSDTASANKLEEPGEPSNASLRALDRLLTHKEKEKLTCEKKRIYNTKKKLVLAEILKEWPENDKIPSFRNHHFVEKHRLEDFVGRISGIPKYTYPECALGHCAIKEMVMSHMRERRRKHRLGDIYQATGNTTTESEVESEDSNTSPVSSPTRKLYEEYFHPSLSQESCNTIVMVALEKQSFKDVQLSKHLTPLKKLFGLTLLRGQDKNCMIRAVANSLYSNGYVSFPEESVVNLNRQDIKALKSLK